SEPESALSPWLKAWSQAETAHKAARLFLYLPLWSARRPAPHLCLGRRIVLSAVQALSQGPPSPALGRFNAVLAMRSGNKQQSGLLQPATCSIESISGLARRLLSPGPTLPFPPPAVPQIG